ncbi:MAG: MBL fold metallo-hydrolase [Chloroflexi bacterium]|nr:MBL fold metallo-hydrolase [Chloroflexota bacterium]
MAEWMLEDEFGDVIGKARRGNGLSVEELAEASGVEAAVVAAFEGYRRDPSESESGVLAEALGLRAAQLWELAQEGWLPQRPDPDLGDGTVVESLYFAPDRVWAYLLGDGESCVAIDCGAPLEEMLTAIGDRQLLGIVLTHADADHIYSLEGLLARGAVPVYVHSSEVDRVSAPQVIGFDDGDLIELGRYRFSVLHAPGHTSGCCGLHVPGAVFTGDTIFAGSVGGTRMGASYYRGHLGAVRAKILSLPGETKLFHGHGAHSSVADELAHNCFF